MDKLKKSLKHLFAPAIVLILVAVMGIFSPVVSVVAALRVNAMAGGLNGTTAYEITNLPARTVEVGTSITTPSVTNNGVVKLCHAGKEIVIRDGVGGIDDITTYKYAEIGQYEWRFYANDVLFNTYTVTVTDTTYGMTLPENVVTVAPKDLTSLTLPLPTAYKVDGVSVEVEKIEKGDDATLFGGAYANITVDGVVKYVLTAEVARENHAIPANDISIDQNGTVINLGDTQKTGVLKVTYKLYNADGQKLLAAMPLSNIEIKDVTADKVTFANIPTAPSVKNLAYYSTIALSAPTADSAKVGSTSFNVEAQTKIVKVQCSPYSTEPSDWSKASDKIINLTVEKNNDGQWVVKQNGVETDKYLEIDGLKVKIKALGWYRFQFETSTLFGYQMDENFDAEKNNVEQGANNSSVRYWSDSVRINRDSIEPNFAWVEGYDKTNESTIAENNEKFDSLSSKYANALPMTDKPDASTTKKITVDAENGLVLPAIFPHDNATPFDKMKVTTFHIEQIQDKNGNSATGNYAYNSTDKNDANNFVYDYTKPLTISFVNENPTSSGNTVQLVKNEGLYRIRVVVEAAQPEFANGESSANYGNNTKTKYLYFYVNGNFEHETNTPKIDESNVFQVSDVYLSEGNTFGFNKPTVTDNYTPTDKITVDYYLVANITDTTAWNGNTGIQVLSQLDTGDNKLRGTVDLDNLYAFNAAAGENSKTKLTMETLAKCDNLYIYAVARNFNAMQANLRKEFETVLNPTAGTYFDNTLISGNNLDEFAQYGYAWKRAEFKIHAVNSDAEATIEEPDFTDGNKYVATEDVEIDSISMTWNGAVDGQMSVAVYQVKGTKMVPVNVYNSNDEIVSSISSYGNSLALEKLYFTPGVSGEYKLVVTAKAFGSEKVTTSVTNITIESSGDWGVTPLSLSTLASNDYTVDKTIALGETLVLPNWVISKDSSSTEKYFAKNRQLYSYATGSVEGYYTVTVMGVNDPNCILGNNFAPNKEGQYTFQYKFYKNGSSDALKTVNYVVQVNNNNTANETIRVGEAYKDAGVLWNTETTDNATGTATTGKHLVDGKEYELSGDFTEKNPAYAITLNQFVDSNYGAATDFVVNSASLWKYLEPIYEDDAITGYMYPAIAIPMPNLITDTQSSDDVEITVQSSDGTYLVSSKKKNAGGSVDKASVIDPIKEYFVFRPEGKFDANCKTEYDASNYLEAAKKQSSVAGVYTVSYKTSTTSLSFNVTFGNLQNGSLAWNEGFLTYNNDDGKGNQEITKENTQNVVIENVNGHRYVTIDMSKVYFTGNTDMEALIANGPHPEDDNAGINPNDLAAAYLYENVKVSVSFDGAAFIDSSDWTDKADETKAIKITEDGKFMYKFDLIRGSGTYKVNISMPNKYTNSSVSTSIEFTIDVDVTNRKHNLNNVWGIILMVLSIGLLAGVVYYFVKTARATRFVDAPRAAKKVKAPKKEDTKEDVK